MDADSTSARVRNLALREAWVAFVAVSAAALLVIHGGERTPLAEYVSLAVGLLFLVAAVKLAERDDPSLERYGLALGGLLSLGDHGTEPASERWKRRVMSAAREVGVALAVAVVVFPPFAAGFYLWNRWQHGAMHPFAWRLPPDTLSFFVTQIVVVALAEEAFFRGYLQTRFSDAWPRRRRILGAEISVPAWFCSAALFGVVHVAADINPARFAVFFPGLLFGLLRARRGGIGAAMVFHALCNTYSEFLTFNWFG